jgi:hypothetical protein
VVIIANVCWRDNNRNPQIFGGGQAFKKWDCPSEIGTVGNCYLLYQVTAVVLCTPACMLGVHWAFRSHLPPPTHPPIIVIGICSQLWSKNTTIKFGLCMTTSVGYPSTCEVTLSPPLSTHVHMGEILVAYYLLKHNVFRSSDFWPNCWSCLLIELAGTSSFYVGCLKGLESWVCHVVVSPVKMH